MALLTTIAEWRRIMPMASEIELSSLPKTDIAESKYLLPILGQALYDALQTAYTNNTMTTAQSKLLIYCQGIIGPHSIIRTLPLKQTLLSDAGLLVNENENNPRPFKWQYHEAITALYNIAYEHYELLITYLRANRTTFTDWASSPYNAASVFHIIRDGDELREVLPIDMPHRCYWALKPLFDSHCAEFMITNIGSEYYADLNTRLKADGFDKASNEYLFVVRKLRMAAARYAMKYAAIEMSLRFSPNGFTIVDEIKDNAEEGRTDAGATRLNLFINEMGEAAGKFMQEAVDYLNNNASVSVFDTYYNSSKYVNPTAVTRHADNNRKGIFHAR